MKINYHHPTFIQYKKSRQFIFSLPYEKDVNREKKIENIWQPSRPQ
jgi:hypothetical protein